MVGVGEDPTADDISRVFTELNDMIEAWGLDNYLVYTSVVENFPTVSGTGSYSIGTGATWNTARPLSISQAYMRLGTVDYPVRIIQLDEYNSLVVKGLQSSPSIYLYYDPSYPNGTVYLWPVPSAVKSVYITSTKQFTRFASLNTTVSLPSGYARALKWNLIVECSEAFGKEPPMSIVAKARQSKNALRNINTKPLKMGFDSIITGHNRGYNIYTDGLS